MEGLYRRRVWNEFMGDAEPWMEVSRTQCSHMSHLQ